MKEKEIMGISIDRGWIRNNANFMESRRCKINNGDRCIGCPLEDAITRVEHDIKFENLLMRARSGECFTGDNDKEIIILRHEKIWYRGDEWSDPDNQSSIDLLFQGLIHHYARRHCSGYDKITVERLLLYIDLADVYYTTSIDYDYKAKEELRARLKLMRKNKPLPLISWDLYELEVPLVDNPCRWSTYNMIESEWECSNPASPITSTMHYCTPTEPCFKSKKGKEGIIGRKGKA